MSSTLARKFLLTFVCRTPDSGLAKSALEKRNYSCKHGKAIQRDKNSWYSIFRVSKRSIFFRITTPAKCFPLCGKKCCWKLGLDEMIPLTAKSISTTLFDIRPTINPIADKERVFTERKNVFTFCLRATSFSDVSTNNSYCAIRTVNRPGSTILVPPGNRISCTRWLSELFTIRLLQLDGAFWRKSHQCHRILG